MVPSTICGSVASVSYWRGLFRARDCPMPRKKSDTAQLKVRLRESLRSRLERAAKASAHPLNSEIVARLEQSFRAEEALGGRDLAALFRMMAAAADFVQARTRQDWHAHYETFRAVERAWDRLWEQFKAMYCPPASPESMAIMSRMPELRLDFPPPPHRPRPRPEDLKEETYDLAHRSIQAPPIFQNIHEAMAAAKEWKQYDALADAYQAKIRSAKQAVAEAEAHLDQYRNIGDAAAAEVKKRTLPPISRRR